MDGSSVTPAGYEVRGLENIPDEGGALLVYYHGALPLDYYYLVASCLLHKRRLIRGVGDRFVFRVPGETRPLSRGFHDFSARASSSVANGSGAMCSAKTRMHAISAVWPIVCAGFKILTDVFKVSPGTVQSCAQVMREGDLLAIAPGGVLEAQFGDERYRLLWKKRLGFAKAAIEARVPVVPVFTQNIREAFRSVAFGRGDYTYSLFVCCMHADTPGIV